MYDNYHHHSAFQANFGFFNPYKLKKKAKFMIDFLIFGRVLGLFNRFLTKEGVRVQSQHRNK